MPTVIDSGTSRNLTNTTDGRTLTPNSAEQRFVTYINDLGAVHTLITDVEHAITDVEQLIKWHNHAAATVSTVSGPEGSPTHVPPDQVIERANAAVGVGGQQSTTDTQGG